MRYIFLIIFLFLFSVSCSKNKVTSGSVAALQVTNAIIGGSNIGFNTNAWDSVVGYNAKVFSLRGGTNSILFYPTSNPIKPFYNSSKMTNNGEIYSAFLHGKLPDVETIWIKDSIPAYYLDSSIGVRVINLSPNSAPIDITLASSPTNKLFASVGYKKLTDFIVLSLKVGRPVGSVNFQVRNSTNNVILATYTIPTSVNGLYPNISTKLSINRCVTLVVKGWLGETVGIDAFGVFPVANY
jgi:hypothetical protein